MAMMNTLKSLVYQKHIFAEQAKLVLDEDENFDRMIFLEDGEEGPELPEGSKDPLQNDNTEVQPEGEQPMPIQTDSPSEETPGDTDSDIMSMELNTSTDTVSNVVPTPPPGAADQLDTPDSPNGGDIMNEPIDSPTTSSTTMDVMDEPIDDVENTSDGEEPSEPSAGTAGEESTDIMNEPIDLSKDDKEKDEVTESYNGYDYKDIFMEDITLDGGGDSSSGGEEKAPDSDLDADDDNTVTAAVKEKVNDSNDESSPEPSEPTPPEDDLGGDDLGGDVGGEDMGSDANKITNKDDLIKKVSSIAKSNIELMAQIQST